MIEELAPVVDALRAQSQQQASAILAAADTDAEHTLATAKADAAKVLAQARADGEATAHRSARLHLSAARREARERVLHARYRVYDAVRAGAITDLSKRSVAHAEFLVDRELMWFGDELERVWA